MNEQKRNEIISRWHAGASIRQIARSLGMARNTVSSVLAQIQARRAGEPDGSPSLRRPSRLDPYQPVILELLTRYPDLTAVRLLEELRQRGFVGCYSLVRQRLSELRPRPQRSPVVRFETGPGAQAQMDYAVYDIDFTSEGRRRVNLFSYILGYSRRQYLRFVESQDMTTTLREHVRAFEHLGGVAATCLYDNMKVVVSGYEDEVPIYNPRFLAFATHYGFRPVACRVRRPQTKGKVERPFFYVETSMFNGRTFSSLEHLNDTTAWWLAHVADLRELRAFGKTPLQLHQEELPRLIPLPAQAYDVAPVIYRTVSVEGLVTYSQNGYSVPSRHIGQMLPVRVTERELIVYSPQLEEVARHVLLPDTEKGRRSVHKEHRRSEDTHQRQAELQARYAELGEAGQRFLEGLLRTQRYGKDQAARVLALLGTYTRSDLIAALARAVRYGAYSHAAVERILSAQARPKSILEVLAAEECKQIPPWLGGDPIAPRPTSVYQYLCESEPHDHDTPETAKGDCGADQAASQDGADQATSQDGAEADRAEPENP
jgi:transposase